MNDIVFDDVTGDLYIEQDYGVLVDVAGGGYNWQGSASGMPNVEFASVRLPIWE